MPDYSYGRLREIEDIIGSETEPEREAARRNRALNCSRRRVSRLEHSGDNDDVLRVASNRQQ